MNIIQSFRNYSLKKYEDLIDFFTGLTVKQIILLIILFGLIIQGICIVLEYAFYNGVLGFYYHRGPDIPIFRTRAETILNGGLLYRDVHTETPPIVNYLMTIPVIFGGSYISFEIFFSICNTISALLLFYIFKNQSRIKATMIAILFLINPFTFYHSTFNCQDEPLILLSFIIPLVLFITSKYKESAFMTGIGIWTKMWAGLLVPLFLIYRYKILNKIKWLLIIISTSLLVMIPFIYLTYDNFVWFLKFYFLGIEGRSTGGVSIWYFLNKIGLKPPSIIILILIVIYILLSILHSIKNRYNPWLTMTLLVGGFFILYPKIHSGYYLIPFTLLLPYIYNKSKYYLLSILMFVTVFISFRFSDGTFSTEGFNIFLPIVLSIITNYFLLLLLYKVLRIGKKAQNTRQHENSFLLPHYFDSR